MAPGHRMSVLYTMTVDTEEEWDWNAGWPTENLSLRNIDVLPRFQDICDRYGVATTYFANQAVLDSPAARDVLLSLTDRPNVEVGMHIHPWNTRPLVHDGAVRARDTFLHNLPADVARAKLTTVWESFQRIGLAPRSFRGGRYSSGGMIHQFLQERGFVADASVCPFTTWSDDGAPDYRDRGLDPVRVPPRPAGHSPLWEIPLTLAFTRRPFQLWQRWYDLVERTWLGKLRLIGIGERVGLVRKVWLNFESPLGADMETLVDRVEHLGVPAICFTVHSSSLMAGGNPFTPTERDAERLFAQLERVFKRVHSNPTLEPATMSQVAQRLEANFHANSRN